MHLILPASCKDKVAHIVFLFSKTFCLSLRKRHEKSGLEYRGENGKNYFQWRAGMGVHKLSVSCSVIYDSLRFHGLKPSRLLCPWNTPGKNAEVGSLSLLQGIFLTQGSNPGLPALQEDSLPSEPPGKP